MNEVRTALPPCPKELIHERRFVRKRDAVLTANRLASAPAVDRSGSAGLLDQVLDARRRRAGFSASLDAFLSEPEWARAVELWLAKPRRLRSRPDARSCPTLLGRDIARLDGLLAEQVNVILHHPRFQQLEASWRGLYSSSSKRNPRGSRSKTSAARSQVRIEMLNVSKAEMLKDFERAAEFDRSQIWRKVYEEEFGMPGGEPFGAIVADYEFTNHPQDVELIGKMAEVAAGSFCPFIAGAVAKSVAAR